MMTPRNIITPFQLLELNVISAQDLAPVARSMRTYAVAWIHPDRKLSTRVDTYGHQNPTWNDKFVFRVDEEFLYADTSAITIDIYALHWFKDIYVGSVRVLISNLITPPSRPFNQGSNPSSSGMRFGALQVRRQSGRPQGILNIGVAVLDSSMRSMPLYSHNSSAVGYRHLMGEQDAYNNHNHLSPRRCTKPELRRVKSDTSSMITSSVQQQGVKVKRGKASSMLSTSEDSYNKSKRKSRSRSKASSIISGSEVSKSKCKGKGRGKSGKSSSVLSEPGLQWRVKIGKASSTLSGSQPNNEPPMKANLGNPSSNVKDSEDSNENLKNNDNNNQKLQIEKPNSSNNGSESTDESSQTTEKFNAFENPRFLQKTLNAYEVKASPIPQFRNTPGPMLHHQQPIGFGGSNKGTPMHAAAAGLGGSNKGTPMHAAVGLGASNKGTPMHAAMGLGASNKVTPRGTPLHSIGRFNPAFEYATPRRSNLGGKAPPVLTESELGPSPSEVAAALAKYPRADEGESSTVGGWSLDESVEGLQSKLERWRTELPPVYDYGERSSYAPSSKKSSHIRRHTDGGNGLFSCFSNICGCQCTIVCGGGKAKKKAAGRRRTPSVVSESMV